ncbi:MAG: protein phosphatase 2C domain-containing protein [Pseudanabaenaceae cyanobacterium bins.68]|nr:protein phosphatase 2C domain-containing protein [Pseudanabaenaceae cyanobacterium bins.68]
MHTSEPSPSKLNGYLSVNLPAQHSDLSNTVPQSYLWLVGASSGDLLPGNLLHDRYLVHDRQVVSDSQMFRLPDCPDDFSPLVATYLKLSCFQLHLPRPYAVLGDQQEILVLENVPISATGVVMPSLAESWAEATPLRQLNWLYQVLFLWPFLADFGVASTFLRPELVRIDGCWVRILELAPDQGKAELIGLGELWQSWLGGVSPEIEEGVAELFYGLSRGEFKAQQAIAQVEKLTAQVLASSTLSTRVAAATDTGSRREHNEDYCYPNGDLDLDYLRDRAVIICDGLGGHEGGEVASKMAIASISQGLNHLLRQVETDSQNFSSTWFKEQLHNLVGQANDQIVAQNDQNHRHAQQRMGTTLVMAVMPRPQGQPCNQVFVVNVGDSRLYWVNSRNCYQVTVDDDVATRDVVLGYSLPAYANQRMDAGALTQALGTRSKEYLNPSYYSLLVDEACVLLLCSDGLSDYERVMEVWRLEILPLLIGRQTVRDACRGLIDQGNSRNGHDNITVGLIACQFLADTPTSVAPVDLVIGQNTDLDLDQTQVAPEPAIASPQPRLLTLVILLLICFAVGIGVAVRQAETPDLVPSSVSPVKP